MTDKPVDVARQRLLRTYETTRPECFDDLLYCCAVTIEDSLIMGGAKPGQDYRVLDLYQMAMPLALAHSNDTTTITTGIPNTHPSASNTPPLRLVDPEKEALSLIVEISGPTQPDPNDEWIRKKHLNQKFKQAGWDLKVASKVMLQLKESRLIESLRVYVEKHPCFPLGDYVRPTPRGRKQVGEYWRHADRGTA